MTRKEVLRVCGTSNGRRFLRKDEFASLDALGRTEAILWLVWPWPLKLAMIQCLAKTKTQRGMDLRYLEKSGRVARVIGLRGYWRFKPGS